MVTRADKIPPIANAGPNQTAKRGKCILDGPIQLDPDHPGGNRDRRPFLLGSRGFREPTKGCFYRGPTRGQNPVSGARFGVAGNFVLGSGG